MPTITDCKTGVTTPVVPCCTADHLDEAWEAYRQGRLPFTMFLLVLVTAEEEIQRDSKWVLKTVK
jgi:hypothetical protein